MFHIVYKDCKTREDINLPVFCTDADVTLARYILQAINVSNLVKDGEGNLIFPRESVANWSPICAISELGLPNSKKVIKTLSGLNVPGICYVNSVPTLFIVKNDTVYAYDPTKIEARYNAIHLVVDWVGKDLASKLTQG